MQGRELLETINSLGPPGAVAAVLRHAERFRILDPAEPTLAELTPAGATAAENFGRQIAGFNRLRIFHSPVKRCQQTAENIARGAGAAGLAIDLVAPQPELGVEYIRDLAEFGRLSAQYGRHFVRLWFLGKIASSVIQPAAQIAAEKLAYLDRLLQETGPAGRRLDLHISHDWNVNVLRELVLRVRHEEAGWPEFLDGVAFTSGADGLRVVYRERTEQQLLPWSFRSAS